LETTNNILYNWGRTASYPNAPTKIPECGITAQGSSKLLDLHTAPILSPQKARQIRGSARLSSSCRQWWLT